MNHLQNTKLSLYEWTAISLVLLSFLFLTFINVINHHCESEGVSLPVNQSIVLSINGEVENPGSYEFPKGVTLEKVFEKIKLLPDANIKRLKMKSKIYNNMTVIVEKEPKIQVTLKRGADDSLTVETIEGITLKKFFDFNNVDLTQYKRNYGRMNRKLKNGEVIELIPREIKN